MTKRHADLVIGQVYSNRNDRNYLCKASAGEGAYIMERMTDQWTLKAHVITMYDDGTIEWDYSTGGHWPARFEVWKDCELGQTYLERSFSTRQEANEWMDANEKYFPGWHLRIVEK